MGRNRRLVPFLIREIAVGHFGPSGSRFPTVQELAKYCQASYVTTERAFTELRDMGYLRSYGYSTFLTSGPMGSDTAFARWLAERRNGKRFFGLHLNRIDNQFFTSLAAQLIPILKQDGWELIVMASDGDTEAERRILDEFIDLGVSGIFSCPGKENVYDRCVLPVVFLGRSVIGGNSVQVNNKNAGAQMAAHMIEEGYRRFLYIGTSILPAEQDYRLIGFREYLAANGYLLRPDDTFFIHAADPAKDEQLHLIRRQIKESLFPVGIFCYHDIIAFGILDLCRRSGIDVPEKAGVAGFDDLQAANYM